MLPFNFLLKGADQIFTLAELGDVFFAREVLERDSRLVVWNVCTILVATLAWTMVGIRKIGPTFLVDACPASHAAGYIEVIELLLRSIQKLIVSIFIYFFCLT